jgi:hypothetical protein
MKKKKKKNIYKGPVLALTHEINNDNFRCIGQTFSLLAKKLELDENIFLHIISTIMKDNNYSSDDIITEQIWAKIKEFVLNKLSLIARKDKIIEAKTVKTLAIVKKREKQKREKQKNRKFKSSPYFIKGNLRKAILNGMTN